MADDLTDPRQVQGADVMLNRVLIALRLRKPPPPPMSLPIGASHSQPVQRDRRGFLGSLLAAPAIVRSGVLMPIRPLILPAASGAWNENAIYLSWPSAWDPHGRRGWVRVSGIELFNGRINLNENWMPRLAP